MAVWEEILPHLQKGCRLVKVRRAEPAWELYMEDGVIWGVYNNTVTALYSRGLITHRLTDDGLEAEYVQGSSCSDGRAQ